VLYVDKRIQSDQKDIDWEFVDDKELAKQGENTAVNFGFLPYFLTIINAFLLLYFL